MRLVLLKLIGGDSVLLKLCLLLVDSVLELCELIDLDIVKELLFEGVVLGEVHSVVVLKNRLSLAGYSSQ